MSSLDTSGRAASSSGASPRLLLLRVEEANGLGDATAGCNPSAKVALLDGNGAVVEEHTTRQLFGTANPDWRESFLLGE